MVLVVGSVFSPVNGWVSVPILGLPHMSLLTYSTPADSACTVHARVIASSSPFLWHPNPHFQKPQE
eukprot:4130305-Amphidinium_carterae.1